MIAMVMEWISLSLCIRRSFVIATIPTIRSIASIASIAMAMMTMAVMESLRFCRPLVDIAYISLSTRFCRSLVISTLIVSIVFGGASEVMVEGFRISVWLRSSFSIAITSSISTISSITIVVMAAIAMCICIRCGFGLRIRLSESRREKRRSKKQESGGSWQTKAGMPSKSSHDEDRKKSTLPYNV